MAAVYVPIPRFGDDSLTDFHHGLLRDRLLQAGFATVALYGDLDGAPYGLDAARLVAVARADT
jgi:hypothetical protein